MLGLFIIFAILIGPSVDFFFRLFRIQTRSKSSQPAPEGAD